MTCVDGVCIDMQAAQESRSLEGMREKVAQSQREAERALEQEEIGRASCRERV